MIGRVIKRNCEIFVSGNMQYKSAVFICRLVLSVLKRGRVSGMHNEPGVFWDDF